MAPLRILHVGYGFRPLRDGGLAAYQEDLSQAQLAAGHRVAWFCAGRSYPWLRRPRLRRWTRDGVRVHEVLNSPIVVGYEAGTLSPLRDLDDPAVERLFARTLDEVGPDVVHVQELLGVPSAILDVARGRGVPVVMTLHDYGALCPTLKLLDAGGRVNLRTQVGEECARCSRAAPADDAFVRTKTIWMHHAQLMEAHPRLRGVGPRVKKLAAPVLARRSAAPAPAAPAPEPPPARIAPPHEYQRRRDVNVERLNRIERLIPVSSRVGEIYRLLGVSGDRMRPLPPTLSHLSEMTLRPAPYTAGGRPLHLAASSALASVEKGGEILTGALERLAARGLADRFRFTALGYVRPDFAARLDRLPNVRCTGTYDAAELDARLQDVDVGIVPSAWEEAYGLVGPEFLAKGIPVIGNAIGGIVDYVREGETGWLNRDCSAEGLAGIVALLLERPEEVAALHRSVRARRPEEIQPMAAHAEAVAGVYREAAVSASPAARATAGAAPR